MCKAEHMILAENHPRTSLQNSPFSDLPAVDVAQGAFTRCQCDHSLIAKYLLIQFDHTNLYNRSRQI